LLSSLTEREDAFNQQAKHTQNGLERQEALPDKRVAQSFDLIPNPFGQLLVARDFGDFLPFFFPR
jgi:hypothetical protein